MDTVIAGVGDDAPLRIMWRNWYSTLESDQLSRIRTTTLDLFTMPCETCNKVIELYGTNEMVSSWLCKCSKLSADKIINRQIAIFCNQGCCENVPIVNGIIICRQARYWRGVF